MAIFFEAMKTFREPDVISLIFFLVACVIFWMGGRLFRQDKGRVSILFAFAALLLVIFFSVYVYFLGLGKFCEYLHCRIQGEEGWKYLFYSILMIPVLWVLIIVSASRKKCHDDI